MTGRYSISPAQSRLQSTGLAALLLLSVLPQNHPRPSTPTIIKTNLMPNDIFEEYKDYNVRDWDGDDAEPITPETVEVARAVHDALPRTLQSPDIGPGADGTIAFQWRLGFRDRPSFVIIEAGPGNIIQGRIINAEGVATYRSPTLSRNASDIENLISRLFATDYALAAE